MAGDYTGPGHRLVSGETPTVGLRVLTNDLKWGTITEVKDPDGEVTCGWYCVAWHTVIDEDGKPLGIFNCDRLTTKMPAKWA
jgi:hypothetical protein